MAEEKTSLALYDYMEIERKINILAEQNDGEIPDDKLKNLIEAQTRSIEKVTNLCHWLRHIELFIGACDNEVKRIQNLQKMMTNRISRAKVYLLPYVLEHKRVQAGTFELTTRKSEAVNVIDGFDEPYFCKEKITRTPDKKLIKEALKKGEEVPGCEIEKRTNLVIR